MEKNKRFNLKTNSLNGRLARSPSPKRVPDTDSENSPVPIALTQEFTDNIDVVWDWNSPQAKTHPKKCQKRLLLQSPKIPLKRHSSNSSIQDFEKLREELKSLREELAIPDHEESLLLSPNEEANYKSAVDSLVHQIQEDDFDELMDDNINEKLFAFSQQVEEDLKVVKTMNNPCLSNNSSPKLSFKKTNAKEKELANDSFDDLLKSVDVEFLEDSPPANTAANNHSIYTNSGKVEFHRTQSFEIANMTTRETYSKTCTQNEIERKKLEALAKLEAKKKSAVSVTSQCSSKEIEQKRLQALAKVESKRQHEIIERKRQEALKRLQMKRLKNATTVKKVL